MTVNDQFWVTTAAIVIGPLAAVLIAYFLSKWQSSRDRRLEVFRSLMKNRRQKLHPDHVTALNLVEIEFHNYPSVLSKYSSLMSIINDMEPREGESEELYASRILEPLEDRFAELLHEMSVSLGFKHQPIQLLRGGYRPKLYQQIEDDQKKGIKLLANLHDLSRGRGLPIDVVDYRTAEQMRAAAQWAEEQMREGKEP